MIEPPFTVPSVMYAPPGATPPLPTLVPGGTSIEDRRTGLGSLDDLDAVLGTLDSALLLLNLAGYVGREIVVDIPPSDGAADVDPVVLDLGSGLVLNEPTNPWTGATSVAGSVGVWVEPRPQFPGWAQPPADSPNVGPVDFGALPRPPEGSLLDFGPAAPGWLMLPLDPGAGSAWGPRLLVAVAALADTLRTGIADAHVASGRAPGDVPAAGLLGIYHPAIWALPESAGEHQRQAWDTFNPKFVALAERVYDHLLGDAGIGIDLLLDQEASMTDGPPFAPDLADPTSDRMHSASERLAESLPVKDRAATTRKDESTLRDLGVALAPPYATPDPDYPIGLTDLRATTWTRLLMRLQKGDVLDFLGNFGDRYGGFSLRRDDSDQT